MTNITNEPTHLSAASESTYDLLISVGDTVTSARLERGRSYVLGRSPDSDIPLQSVSVSRRHTRLVVGDGVRAEDLGSSNGTRVAGRLLASGESALVPIGTVLELGSAALVLQRGSDVPLPVAVARVPSIPPPKGAAVSTGPLVFDATMQNLYAMIDLVAPTTLSVLILGETGVGKEVFAHEIHRRSRRAGSAFLQLNCAALPASILESELFGYEKGAFTGATAPKAGLFESAHKGTVFLDEVGDMPLMTQAKMLRFLESGEVMRLGSVKSKRVDVRIISATNRELGAAMDAGEFRTDLYYRLNGMTFTVPPLRQRKADIAPLAKMFVDLAAARLDRPPPSIEPAAIEVLEARRWRGNVRELRNVVERAVVISGANGGRSLGPEHFPEDVIVTEQTRRVEEGFSGFSDIPTAPTAKVPRPPPGPEGGSAEDLTSALRDLERQRVTAALETSGYNQSKAARELGISRGALINRMKAYGLGAPGERAAVRGEPPVPPNTKPRPK